MVFQLFFNIPNYTEEHSSFPIPISGDYSYWFSLLSFFLAKANKIEIHCWNEESETIDELKCIQKESFEIDFEEHMTIFKGRKTEVLGSYLLNHHLNKSGNLKWFTVNLNQDFKHVFHSGHWGTEFFVPAASEKEIAFIKDVTPNETGFLKYE